MPCSPATYIGRMASAVATTNRWILLVAVLLVVPGTLASIAFGAIGLAMLLLLAFDWVVTVVVKPERHRRTLPAPIQLLLAAVVASVFGGAIGLAAWIV